MSCYNALKYTEFIVPWTPCLDPDLGRNKADQELRIHQWLEFIEGLHPPGSGGRPAADAHLCVSLASYELLR
ncbi:hypothetical protein U9M48_015044 [Paspalum notatum var. saurae]|uniref:Uncharacterized protein n=1 Tax=Paspalum notatum var. saurae TaxID=547442 RepID=A0AAQ3WL85_PASNO